MKFAYFLQKYAHFIYKGFFKHYYPKRKLFFLDQLVAKLADFTHIGIFGYGESNGIIIFLQKYMPDHESLYA
jgi:hypothetical protein